jgi:rod shape-determining protein MreB and related proteins
VLNPFQHPRVLFADFVIGEELLKRIIHEISGERLMAPAPAVVVHAMEKTEGGLTMIEHRAFMEFAAGAGARHTEVYEGPELPIAGFEGAFKARQASSA